MFSTQILSHNHVDWNHPKFQLLTSSQHNKLNLAICLVCGLDFKILVDELKNI